MQLSTFNLEDEHKGTIAQKLEEAQEVKFTIGRPRAALQKVQRNQVKERPVEETEEQVLQGLALTKTTTTAAAAAAAPSIATCEGNKVESGLPPKPAAAAAVAVAALSREAAFNSPTPTPRVRPPSRGEYREYGPGEYNAMIARRARSFEREAGAGYRGGSSGLRKRDASWDRKWRDEQDRNRYIGHSDTHL